MRIHSIIKCSLADFPGKVCATLFLTGCNFRCTFCHNTPILSVSEKGCVAEADVLSYLEKRRTLLDGVCVTGGEPTLQGDLAFYLREIKNLGLAIKLDTNGSRPDVLKALAADGLVDYIAMDIKTAPDLYPALCHPDPAEKDPLIAILQSVDWLLTEDPLPYEFRTTLLHGYHTEDLLLRIAGWLNGAGCYVLQNFSPAPDVPDPSLHGFLPEELTALKQLLAPYFRTVEIRA